MPISASVYDYIRRQDFDAFVAGAKKFNVHILVRRTNPASLKFIGQNGYSPKPVDCKVKTADKDVMLSSGEMVKCAGLVVDPMIPGFDKAFSERKYAAAKTEWLKFALAHGVWNSSLYSGSIAGTADDRHNIHSGETYRKGYSKASVDGKTVKTPHRGGVFLVQLERQHAHFGCLMFCPIDVDHFPDDPDEGTRPLASRETNKFLHGDYDLFGVVPRDAPELRQVEEAILFGKKNIYTTNTKELALFLNNAFKAEMIQHGAQENAPMRLDEDEHLDVFWADGSHTDVRGKAAIEKLYSGWFRGRRFEKPKR